MYSLRVYIIYLNFLVRCFWHHAFSIWETIQRLVWFIQGGFGGQEQHWEHQRELWEQLPGVPSGWISALSVTSQSSIHFGPACYLYDQRLVIHTQESIWSAMSTYCSFYNMCGSVNQVQTGLGFWVGVGLGSNCVDHGPDIYRRGTKSKRQSWPVNLKAEMLWDRRVQGILASRNLSCLLSVEKFQGFITLEMMQKLH